MGPAMNKIAFEVLMICAVAACSLASAADMESFNCGKALIQIGDADTKVVRECGKPAFEEKGQWFYCFGPDQPVAVISTRDGQVTALEFQDEE